MHCLVTATVRLGCDNSLCPGLSPVRMSISTQPNGKIIQSLPNTPFMFWEQCSGNRVPGTVFLIADSFLNSQTSNWTNSFCIQSGISTRSLWILECLDDYVLD